MLIRKKSTLLVVLVTLFGILTGLSLPKSAVATSTDYCEYDVCIYNAFCWTFLARTGCDVTGGSPYCSTYFCDPE